MIGGESDYAKSWNRPPAGEKRPRPDRVLVTVGYLASLFLPIAGVVIGIVLVARKNDHGWVIISISIAVAAAFIFGYLGRN